MSTISDEYIAHLASHLTDDGDTYEPEGSGFTWKLHIESDPDLTPGDVEDDEVFGRYEIRNYHENTNRPDGFSGAAVKIQDDSTQGYWYWYEPPAHLRKFRGSGFETPAQWEQAKRDNLMYVRNLLSWGYIQIGITCTHARQDGYSRTWTEWIGGVESGTGLSGDARKHHNAYVAELIREQIGEVLAQIGEQAMYEVES